MSFDCMVFTVVQIEHGLVTLHCT